MRSYCLDEMITSIYYVFQNRRKNKWLIIWLPRRLSVTWVLFVNLKGTRLQAHHYHGIRVIIVNFLTLLVFAENMIEANNKTCKPQLKSECQQESRKIRNKRQKCENPNLLKTPVVVVVHVQLLIDMWFISQIDFVLAKNGDTRFQGQTCEN